MGGRAQELFARDKSYREKGREASGSDQQQWRALGFSSPRPSRGCAGPAASMPRPPAAALIDPTARQLMTSFLLLPLTHAAPASPAPHLSEV